MKLSEVINKGYSRNLLLLMLCAFVIFTGLSALYLYLDLNRSLDTHYSAVVSILADTHETLFLKTLKINAVYMLLVFAGILIIGILYTHRIVGPLHRVKLCARSVTEGRIDSKINFRKKDAINLMGDRFNEMTKNYSDRIEEINSETESLRKSLDDLKSSIEKGEDSEKNMAGALEKNKRIKELISEMKV